MDRRKGKERLIKDIPVSEECQLIDRWQNISPIEIYWTSVRAVQLSPVTGARIAFVQQSKKRTQMLFQIGWQRIGLVRTVNRKWPSPTLTKQRYSVQVGTRQLRSHSSNTIRCIAVFCPLLDIVQSVIEKLHHRIQLPLIDSFYTIYAISKRINAAL